MDNKEMLYYMLENNFYKSGHLLQTFLFVCGFFLHEESTYYNRL